MTLSSVTTPSITPLEGNYSPSPLGEGQGGEAVGEQAVGGQAVGGQAVGGEAVFTRATALACAP